MTDTCGCPPEAGSAVCELPAQNFQRPARAANTCPECGKTTRKLLNATVAREVFACRVEEHGMVLTCGCPVVREAMTRVPHGTEGCRALPDWAGDVQAALRLVEKLGNVQLFPPYGRLAWRAKFSGFRDQSPQASFETPQEAICRAAVEFVRDGRKP